MPAPRKPIKRRKVTTACMFHEAGKEPDYKDYKFLAKFLTDRAKIVGSMYTGVCSKHQRKLTKAIKNARHLGLLPYTASI